MGSKDRNGSATEEEAMVHLHESSGHSGKSEETRENSDNYKSFNSLGSSSSQSSSDDFFEVDPIITSSSKTTDHKKSEENRAHDSLYSGPLFELEEMFCSSGSFSHFSAVSHDSSIPASSSTRSPPTQVMDRQRGPDDSDHILGFPASISARPSSQIDWSIVSNDSLFSIPIGSCRFSRDQGVGLGGDPARTHKDIGRSGEIDKKTKENVHNKTSRETDEASTDEDQNDGKSCAFPRKNSSQPSGGCEFCSGKWPSCSSCCSGNQPRCTCMPSYRCKS